MTQNLRISGTVSAEYSNFSSGSINVSQYNLKTDASNKCNNPNGYDNPCSRTPDSTDMSTIGSGVTAKSIGAWYNFYAVSAGAISNSSNSSVMSSDICPSGWHLPTGSAYNSSSEFYKLLQTTSTSWVNANYYLTAFGAIKGGFYKTGTLSNATKGYFWSAANVNGVNRYDLAYDSSNGKFTGNDGSRRFNGQFVRCTKSS